MSTNPEGDEVSVEAAGREMTISHPGKVLFPERGETKLDLVHYYQAVEEPLMRAMGGRPVLLQRFPNGATGPSFFQKRVPEQRPDWLETVVVSTPNGTTSQALVARDLAHVLWAVNLACLGFHVWPSRAADPEHADQLRIDLDPTPGVTFPWSRKRRRRSAPCSSSSAWWPARRRQGTAASTCSPPSSRDGPPIEVRDAAVAVARELERRRPDLITAAWWKEERGTRVFVDFNQNAPHKTIFGAWSVRARPGAQVSTPFALGRTGQHRPRRAHGGHRPRPGAPQDDPWEVMEDEPQSLEPVLALHQRDRAAGLLDAPWPPVYPKMPGEPPRVAPSRAKKPKA